jgi:hypothetical protein
MGSNAYEGNIWGSMRVDNANPRRDWHRGVPAEHAARLAAHDVEHVERNTDADAAYSFRPPLREAGGAPAWTRCNQGPPLHIDASGYVQSEEWHRIDAQRCDRTVFCW